MFCPNCRSEYREGFTVCAECNVALVPELPPEPEPEYVEWVTVLTTSDESSALVAETVLEAAEIPCAIKGEGLEEIFPTMNAKEVQVPVEYEEEARQLLEAEAFPKEAGEFDVDTGNEDEQE